MSDFLLATFLFALYMSFISWGLAELQPTNLKTTLPNRNTPTLADYAYAFAFEPEVEQPAIPTPELIEYSPVPLPDPWELTPATQPISGFCAITSVKPLLLLPPAGLKNTKAKEKNFKFISKSKQPRKANTQKGNRFNRMNIRQLKQEASSWNKLHPELKIVNLGRLSKQQLIERLTALTA